MTQPSGDSHRLNPKTDSDEHLKSIGQKQSTLVREVFDHLLKNRPLLDEVINHSSLTPLAHAISAKMNVARRTTHDHLGFLDNIVKKGERDFNMVLSGSNLLEHERVTLLVLLSDRFKNGGSARRALEQAYPGRLPPTIAEADLCAGVDDNPDSAMMLPLAKIVPAINNSIHRAPPFVAMAINEAKQDPAIEQVLHGHQLDSRDKQTVKDYIGTWSAASMFSDAWEDGLAEAANRSRTTSTGSKAAAADTVSNNYELDGLSCRSLTGPYQAWQNGHGDLIRANGDEAMILVPTATGKPKKLVGKLPNIQRVLSVVRENQAAGKSNQKSRTLHNVTPEEIANLSEGVIRATLLTALGDEATNDLMPQIVQLIQKKIKNAFIQVN